MTNNIKRYYNLVPENLWNQSSVVLSLRDWIITSQSGYPTEGSIGKIPGENHWSLILPNEITENISHNWEEYESIATRLTQKIADIHKGVSTVRSMFGNITDQTNKNVLNRKEWLGKAALKAADINLAQTLNYRVDSTLMYRSSQRREYSLTFNLAESPGVDVKEIFNAVKKLQLLSTPKNVEGDMIKIEFPRIFTVDVFNAARGVEEALLPETNPVIYIENAALVAVQPTWKFPYRDGYATQVDLQLTFKDMDPLFRSNFQNTIVQTWS